MDGAYASLQASPASGPAAKVFPAWPGVEKVEPPLARALGGKPLEEAHAVFASGGDASAARVPMGKGEAVLLAWPELFQNRHVARADHLALLGALAGTGRPVVFDEFVHDVQREASPVEILREWGFGTFLVLAAAAAAIVFWRRGSRLGPEEDDHRETRVEAVDFVDSLALLYGRTLSEGQALALYEKAFEQSVSARTGLKDQALREKVRELLRGSRPADFGRALMALNEAFRRLDDAKRPRSRGAAQGALRRS